MTALSVELLELHRALGIPAEATAGCVPIPEARAAELITIADEPREIQLLRPAAAAWFRLRDAAARDSVVLLPVSGFRSVEHQAGLFRNKCQRGVAIAEILRVNLPPGFSEHHSGRALDISTPGTPPLTAAFAETSAFAWLQGEAGAFGFSLSYPAGNLHGIQFEPWHWLWIAPTNC